MEKICPVCNEIKMKTFPCNNCNGIMVDKGRVQEFLGPYSADMPIEDSKETCEHVFQCTQCNNSENKDIKKIVV